MAERHNLQLSSSRQRLSAGYLLAIVVGGWQLVCEFFLLRQFRPARVFLGAALSEAFDIHVSQRRPFFILYDTTYFEADEQFNSFENPRERDILL